MPRSPSVPKYRHFKPRNLAVVRVRTAAGIRDIYLGAFNSPESHAEYARVLAELATGSAAQKYSPAQRATVDEVVLAFLKFAERHYRRADGEPTDQLDEYKNTVKPLHRLYGHVAAADFGPLALKTVRQAFVDAGNCRTLVNSRIGKLKRLFKWGVAEELVPVAVYSALATVAGLQEGRTEARESEPVEPVEDAVVDATLPQLNRHVAGLVQFQRLTGCRPGEACSLRRCDIDMTGDVWLFRPPQHKGKHKNKIRVIPVGPKAQSLVKEFSTDDVNEFLFSPRRAKEEHNATRAANRKTKNFPSHIKHNAERKKADPRRAPSVRYTRRSYLTAVVRACRRAKVSPWFPYQLRHAHGTAVRHRYGLEAAQVALGHARADVTQVYAERNEALGAKVASEMG